MKKVKFSIESVLSISVSIESEIEKEDSVINEKTVTKIREKDTLDINIFPICESNILALHKVEVDVHNFVFQ